AALARLGVAEAARYPTLRLTGSIDGESPDLSDLFDADSFLANLLAGLTAPIFESGRIEQSILAEQARVEQQALAYRDLLLEALSEAESALASLRLVGRRIEALDGALLAAREAAELAEQRYAAGLVDLLVVLDSQRTLLDLQEQHAAARGERVIAFSNLYRALGGGWQTGPRGETDA
ncbi:MAG: TolC family protein, partial [Holophagales bacterium]|nr:TolC family protein [Holophagales bacterium]